MSAARGGEWHLLDRDEDPVPAKDSDLDKVIQHYKEIAEMMHTQAALLKRVGEGDVTLLKGDSADAMRTRASKTHDALEKAAGRYDDVYSAIKNYQPELRTARSETGEALLEAEAAAKKQQTAEGSSDPVNEDRGEDAEPLTDKDRTTSQNRSNAIAGAKGDIEAAKARADRAMAALDAAAETAKLKIKENWGDDGLNHSWQEAAYHGFMKFLKGLVEVLGWIGMALAIVAMIIPGLQGVAMAALVVGGVALLGSIVLAATGEESWMGVVFGVIGVLTAGAGMAAAKIIGKATKVAKGVAADGVGIQLNNLNNLGKAGGIWRGLGNAADGAFGKTFAINRALSFDLKIAAGIKSIKGLEAAVKINPVAWKVWTWAGAVGIGGTKELKVINSAVQGLGLGLPQAIIKPWVYIMGSGSWFAGLVSGAWSTGVPASSFGDDARENYDGTVDWEYAHFKTPYRGQLEELE